MRRIPLHFIRSQQRAVLRRRKRWKNHVKDRNIRHNQKRKDKNGDKGSTSTSKRIEAPEHFDFENIEGVLKYINRTYKFSKERNCQEIYFEMSGVQTVDTFAICSLLSLLNKLITRKINARGNWPTNEVAKQYILDSGFANFVHTKIRRNRTQWCKNILYQIGGSHVDAQLINSSVKQMVEILMGAPDYFEPVYEDMIEICGNSVEYSNNAVNEKNWIVSITFEDDMAKFLLVDTGEGILRTLNKKTKEKMNDFLSNKSQGQILHSLFMGAYRSASGEANRHLGLPNVLKSFQDGYIDDLTVITNHVKFDFTNNKETQLKNEYHGTMYLWTVTKNNIEKWRNQF